MDKKSGFWTLFHSNTCSKLVQNCTNSQLTRPNVSGNQTAGVIKGSVRPFKIWTSISLEIRFFLNLGVWYSDSYGIFIYLSNVNFGIMFFFRKKYFDKDPREDEENLHKSGFSNQDKEM